MPNTSAHLSSDSASGGSPETLPRVEHLPPPVAPQGPLLPFAAFMGMGAAVVNSPLDSGEVFWTGLGPHDTEMHARRDGYMIFRFDQTKEYAGGEVPGYQPMYGERWPSEYERAQERRHSLAYRRFVYMNAFLTAFYSGMSVIQKTGGQVQAPINPSNYFRAAFIDGAWQVASHVGQAAKSGPVRDIKAETLDHAVSVMTACDRLFGEKGLRPLALIQVACHQYALHQFDTAHLLAWSVIEQQLNLLWANYLNELSAGENSRTAINRKRRDLLTGRDYTASMVSQMLSLAGKIDDSLLDALNQARDKRNKFVHSLTQVNAHDAGKAIRTATDFLSQIVGTKITSQLALGFHI